MANAVCRLETTDTVVEKRSGPDHRGRTDFWHLGLAVVAALRAFDAANPRIPGCSTLEDLVKSGLAEKPKEP